MLPKISVNLLILGQNLKFEFFQHILTIKQAQFAALYSPVCILTSLPTLLPAQVMESSMGAATTLSTPTDQVDQLIKEVADENGLDMISDLQAAPEVGDSLASSSRTLAEEDQLNRRLQALRN